jgi:hypothetical protein
MASRTPKPAPAPDPATAHNRKVLRERQARLDAEMKEIPDLGLNIQDEPQSAAEFLRDAWDKAAFGDELRTVTRWVYGPDPLLDQSPSVLAALEKYGREEYANATAAAILLKGEEAASDPVMRRGLYAAIHGTKTFKGFGKEKVAEAFRERIMAIPARQVEYEVEGEFGDPLMLGSNALRDAVSRYGGEPGMSYKFLSQRCMDVLGMRGYELVLHKGDPVKAGTLFLAKIPMAVADGRRRKYARESQEQVQAQQDEYMEAQARFASADRDHAGTRPLGPNDTLRVKSVAGVDEKSTNEDLLGTDLEMGLKIERQT